MIFDLVASRLNLERSHYLEVWRTPQNSETIAARSPLRSTFKGSNHGLHFLGRRYALYAGWSDAPLRGEWVMAPES
eukprot:5955456-Pleurochrysis_carterae.AAC.5